MSVDALSPGAIRDDEAAPPRTLTLAVEDMHCGGCLRKVEQAVTAVPGVAQARANLSAKRVTAALDPARCSEEAVISALAAAGFKAAPLQPESADADAARDRDFLKRVAVAGFAAANIMLLSVSVWAGIASDMDAATQALFHRLSALIALPAVAYAGQPFFRSALAALKGRRLNMDVPISLAVILATAMSCFQTLQESEQVYFDAAVTLLFFLLIGRWLDQRLRTRARGEAHNLLSLQSGLATAVEPDGTHRTVPAHALMPGDRILVATGDRVPADGVVASGEGEVDQSLITGESTPVAVAAGGQVYSGTLNLGRPMLVDVTAADDMTLLAEIGRLMATAEQGRASYRRLADRAARVYAPAVHLLGAATVVLWLFLGAGWETALTYAIAVLIITCPCALALAVPAVQIAAASRLFRQGVILKSADALERLAEAKAVVFDKTGTLTRGAATLQNGAEIDDDTLRAAAGLAAASRHPYAQAIVRAAGARLGHVPLAADVEEQPGCGLRREDANGEARLGSPAWCGVEAGAEPASVWYRAPDGTATAFRFADALRADAAEVVQRLEQDGLTVALLSGDREEAVAEAATGAGIGDWTGVVTPADKIASLEARGREGPVLMVGDGLNDAPALAAAHVSMSPASAADITMRSADLVFQGERLGPVVTALHVARRARTLAFQNFAIALAYNTVCVPLAMAGYVTPLVAAVAMSTSSILVTANALRLAGRAREAAS